MASSSQPETGHAELPATARETLAEIAALPELLDQAKLLDELARPSTNAESG